MRVQSPAPDVLQLTRFGAFSCHLLRDEDGLTLIDTGLPGSAPAIHRAIVGLGAKLTRILLTHAHTDHCGALDAIHALHPGAEIVASPRTAALMAGDRTLPPAEAHLKLRGGFRTCRATPSRLAADGARIGRFRAVFTHGHAPGHVSYLHEPTGFLFTGDALHTAGGRLAVSGEFRPLFPFPSFATWSRPLALESARRLRALAPAALFPAHGPALHDPIPALERAITHAERQFAQPRPASGPCPAP
jgi:glyoxylase-like metal-dependent hydrolase (beta-lactamase superfamily II)